MTDKILRIENEEEITDIIINRCDGTGYQLYLDELCFEPAPPKDWRPACYNYSELVNGCAQIPFTDKPECQECPYRN